jgi:hypothetical protein
MAKRQHIEIIIGKICSGKGTECRERNDFRIKHGADPYFHVTTSDIVRELSGFTSRSDMSTTIDLDTQIADRMCELIDEHQEIMIDGIRQLSILKTILERYNRVDVIFLDDPDHILKERFINRADAKDDQDFETATRRDDEMGLGDTIAFIREEYKKVPRKQQRYKIISYGLPGTQTIQIQIDGQDHI